MLREGLGVISILLVTDCVGIVEALLWESCYRPAGHRDAPQCKGGSKDFQSSEKASCKGNQQRRQKASGRRSAEAQVTAHPECCVAGVF